MSSRLIALLLVLTMVLLSAGCQKKTDASRSSASDSSADAVLETTSAPEETEAEAEASDSSETAALSEAPVKTSEEITILYTNDVHCGLDTFIGYDGLALLKNAYTAAGKNVLLVDSGDALQGENIASLTHGSAIIDIMNEVGYDVAVPGNHDFDYGVDNLLELSQKANFDYVSCNFMNLGADLDGQLVFQPYVIKEIAGLKIAFVGICTPTTITTSTPTHFMDDNDNYIYGFAQDETGEYLYEMVQLAVDQARSEGADYVIALSHLGSEEAASPWTSSEVINNTRGIDAFLDGHSHSLMEEEWVKNLDGQNVLLTQTKTKLEYVGCLTIGSDGSLSSCLISDNGTASFVADVQSQSAEIENQVVAHTDYDLCIYDPAQPDIRLIRSTETNMGDLCADAFRVISGADIALLNGGGIRADIPAGDITYGQIIAVKPFGNYMMVIEATGEQIWQCLEFASQSLPGEFGGFMQVSGITFTIDTSIDSTVTMDENGMFTGITGERRVKDIMVDGEPLDPAKTYTVASLGYSLKNYGDGFTMFADSKVLQDNTLLESEVVISYIQEQLGGSIPEEYADPYGQGRINILE